MSMAILLAVIAAAVVLFFIAIEWIWWRPKRLESCLRKQGLSGNPYRLFYGDMKDMLKLQEEARSKPSPFTNDILPRVFPQLHHTFLRYGKKSFVWMGRKPMVYITKPELIREVLTSMDFKKPQLNAAIKLLAPGLVSYEGEKWAKHRKMLNPAFHIEKLKLMMAAFYESCAEMVGKWEKMVDEVGSVELDVLPQVTNLASDVISRAAFGSSFEEGRTIFELLKEQIELTIQQFLKYSIPGWRFMPTPANRKIKEVNGKIRTSLVGIIEKKKKAMEAGEAASKEDLLGMLMDNALESRMQNTNNHKKHFVSMTTRDLIDECKLFYFAGQETTSVLLVWTLIMLSKHQVWQERARQEVLEAFGNTKPDFDGLNQLKSVTMILYEVLRLYPPVSEISRRTIHDVKLGELSLPVGVTVNLPVLLVHQDPELWGEDALEFNPERFCEGIVKATGGTNAFFPFGWGPRICIGQNFSLLEAKMALAMFLQHFSFNLSLLYTHAPSSTVTLQPQFGAHIVLHKL